MSFWKCSECEKSMLRISWSGLRTFSECRKRYALKREKKQNNLSNTRNFFPGTVTDRAVRHWLDNDPWNNPGIMPDMVEDIIKQEQENIKKNGQIMKWRDSSDRDNVLRECQEAVRLIEPDLERLVLPNKFLTDYKFEAPLDVTHPDGSQETILLIGYMDIIVATPDKDINVWDVKHTKDDSYWKKTAGQLGFYDLAVNLIHSKDTAETGLLQPLCKERVKPVPLNQGARAKLLSDVLEMAYAVKRDDMRPRADMSQCSWCEVKHACPKFKPTEGSKRMSLFG